MTAPGQNIIQAPGVGQELQQAIAPFVQAMQFQRQLQQRQREQEQDLAAQLFARGLQTPGFESTPAAQELETKLGVPGLSQSIAKARTAEDRAKTENINQLVESMSGVSDKAKAATRASLMCTHRGGTAEVCNALFSAMASGEDLSVLERARIEQMQAGTQKTLLEIEKMKREPGPHDQIRAAQLLNVSPTEFVDGFNYIGVLEDRMKQRETDPGRVIINTMIAAMTQRDYLGRAKMTVEESLALGIRTAQAAFPKTAATIKMTPQLQQVLDATDKVTQVWTDIIDNGNANVEIDPTTGKKNIIDKLPTRAQRREFMERGIKRLYPLLTPQQYNDILDIVGRRVEEYRRISF